MREIQDSTKSDSDSDNNCETGVIAEDFGWETDINSISSREERSKEYNKKLIILADKKVNISLIFKSLNINFTNIVYSPSGWTHNTNCLFKDHNDNSPSFWYNPEQGAFNCFGCHRGGKAVNFLAFYSGDPPSKIAQDLLSKYSNLEESFEEVDEELQEKVDNLILNSSDYFKNFVKNHIDNTKLVEYAENLYWSLDVYLEKLNMMKVDVELENLEARIGIMKRKLAKLE